MNFLSLRARQRVAAMREIQTLALGMFRQDGFEGVTMEQIAAAAGSSASTLYRYFGTKEGVVLWDDLDAPVSKAVVSRLKAGDSPRPAICEAFCTALAEGIAHEGEFHLERIRFIYATPAVYRAAVDQQVEEITALAADLRDLLDEDDDGFTAEVVAGACYAALDSAIKRWVRDAGSTPLTNLMRAAFDALHWGAGTERS